MRVLVTGSSGLIGRELVESMRSAGVDVEEYDVSQGRDICDLDRLSRALHGCDGIVHLAAISRVAWGEADPALCHRVNVEGTRTLIGAALAQDKSPWVVFASSREVYGDPEIVPVSEDAAISPVNHYGRSKAEGERLFERAREQGLRCAVVRLSNVYGTVNDHPDRAVPSLLWRAMAGETLRLSGVEAYFDFVHVTDSARGLMSAARRLAEGDNDLPAIHLATGIRTTLGALAAKVIDVANSGSQIDSLPARRFDVKGFCGNPARARAVLGWNAEIALDEGLRRFHEILLLRGRPMDDVLMPVLPPSKR